MSEDDMNQNSGIPAGIGSVIIIDDEGSRTHYSPEEWRHKQVMGKLDSIEKRLMLLEQLLSGHGDDGQQGEGR
jgi:hypothetical protein